MRYALMAWLVLPLVGVLAVTAWLTYSNAARQARQVTDRLLLASARVIAEDLEFRDGGIWAVIPPAALEMFQSESRDRVVYRLMDADGSLVAGYADLAPPKAAMLDSDVAFYDLVFRAEPMRAAAIRQSVATPRGSRGVLVIVAETVKARSRMVQTLWVGEFLQQALLVIVASAFIWIGISRELNPLMTLRNAVIARPQDRFEPFDAALVQTEIRPLVEALNDYMQRLERQVVRQRRFLDNAAHQLRTPLTVLKTQIGFARKAVDPGEKHETLAAIDADLSAMVRLTNQLLLLARAENDRQTVPMETIDVSTLARDVVAHAAPRALDAGIDLVLDANSPQLVAADAPLLQEILANLIDNTILYSGRGSTAEVSVRGNPGSVVLRVEDNGIGMRQADRSHAFERFRRGSTALGSGSGLGLAIVAEITSLFGGEASIVEVPDGHGLAVEVVLPRQELLSQRPGQQNS